MSDAEISEVVKQSRAIENGGVEGSGLKGSKDGESGV